MTRHTNRTHAAREFQAPEAPPSGEPETLTLDTLDPETPTLGDPTPAQRPEPAYLAPVTLTGAKLAAHNRALNKANGTTGQARPASSGNPANRVSTGERAAGLELELWVTTSAGEISLSFKPVRPDGTTWRMGLAPNERALTNIRWHAYPGDNGELFGFETCSVSNYRAGAGEIERQFPLMARTDRLIEMAREASEDLSLGFVASTLAAHFRVTRVKSKAPDGTEAEHKRGAAYVTAHRAGEALLASLPKPEPVQEADPVPVPLAEPAEAEQPLPMAAE